MNYFLIIALIIIADLLVIALKIKFAKNDATGSLVIDPVDFNEMPRTYSMKNFFDTHPHKNMVIKKLRQTSSAN